MNENKKNGTRYSTKFLLASSVLFSLCLIPTGTMGWRGIYWSGAYLLLLLCFLASYRKSATVGVAFVLIFQFIIYPALQGARPGSQRSACVSNHNKIYYALWEYNLKHGRLPPAYTVDAEGKPLHSWRVWILPELGYEALYKKIHLDLPWDHPKNQPLHNQMPVIYPCHHDGYFSFWGHLSKSHTRISVVADKGTPWEVGSSHKLEKLRPKNDSFGLVLFFESDGNHQNWMDPRCKSLDTLPVFSCHQSPFMIAATATEPGRILIMSAEDPQWDEEEDFQVEDFFRLR